MAQARLPGIDLRFKRLEFQAGLANGQYMATDPYYTVSFKTTPSVFSLGLYGGNFNHIWSLSATRGSFFLQNRPRQSFVTLATYSTRLGMVNEHQNYWFFGATARSYTYSRDLTIDGTTLDSAYATQISPGMVLTYQHHLNRSVLLFTQLMLDIPVYSTMTPTSDQYSQVGGSFNNGILAELSQHTGVGAELQIRQDRSSTFNGVDKTYSSTVEGTLLFKISYIF